MTTFLANNWLWIGFIGLFVVMHRSGHGCGMHSGHGKHPSSDSVEPSESNDRHHSAV